jgi:hypothetical protein
MILRVNIASRLSGIAVSLLILPRITVATSTPGMLSEYGQSAVSVSTNYYLMESLEGIGGRIGVSLMGFLDVGVTIDRSEVEANRNNILSENYWYPLKRVKLNDQSFSESVGPVAYHSDSYTDVTVHRFAPSVALHVRLPNRMISIMVQGSYDWLGYSGGDISYFRTIRSGDGYDVSATLYRQVELTSRVSTVPFVGVRNRRGTYREELYYSHFTDGTIPDILPITYTEKSLLTSLYIGAHMTFRALGGAINVTPSFEHETTGGRRSATLEVGYVLRSTP